MKDIRIVGNSHTMYFFEKQIFYKQDKPTTIDNGAFSIIGGQVTNTGTWIQELKSEKSAIHRTLKLELSNKDDKSPIIIVLGEVDVREMLLRFETDVNDVDKQIVGFVNIYMKFLEENCEDRSKVVLAGTIPYSRAFYAAHSNRLRLKQSACSFNSTLMYACEKNGYSYLSLHPTCILDNDGNVKEEYAPSHSNDVHLNIALTHRDVILPELRRLFP